MVVDIGEVRKYIKPKADSTLYNMRKVDLIEYIRTLEHNYNVAVSFNENQAKYIEQLGFTGVVMCKDCKRCTFCYPIKEIDKEAIPAWYCNSHKGYRKPNDYCSFGERREGE